MTKNKLIQQLHEIKPNYPENQIEVNNLIKKITDSIQSDDVEYLIKISQSLYFEARVIQLELNSHYGTCVLTPTGKLKSRFEKLMNKRLMLLDCFKTINEYITNIMEFGKNN